MIIEPKVKGFICTTAHPTGCRESVRRQIEYTKSLGKKNGAKKVVVIGCSTGYGLASRIAMAFGCGADTIGVSFEKEAKGKRTATAGWYNNAAFDEFAALEGFKSITLNGDGFSDEMKKEVIGKIKENFGKADMLIYSMAAPRRTMEDGTVVSSVLKTVGKPFDNITLDLSTNEIKPVTVPVATDDEIEDTIKVMGGDDWKKWIQALYEADCLSEDAVTLAYTYIGPVVTHSIYKDGSIGQAKKDLHNTAEFLNEKWKDKGLKAYISVNKALVTQSSAAIPIVPLYIALLYKVMKEEGVHEGCIEQMNRLFGEKLPAGEVDENGMFRLDDWEMQPKVQERVDSLWKDVNTGNIEEYGDIEGYWEDFYHMFGFKYDNVDYNADVEI